MSWATAHIGDFVAAGSATIQTGPFGTQLKASDYVSDGTPVINVRNIGFGNLRPDKLEYVADTTKDRLSVHLIRPNDIIFGRKGAVDRHLFATDEHSDWMQGSDCIRLRIEPNELNPRFVSYAFLRETHKQWMLTQSGNKATMASLNQDIIKRIPIPVPSRAAQDAVVEILATYDDLIENNRRRMALLEEAARQLYREWFVRLRFPGHEHTRIIDGVPEGWERKAYDEVCQAVGGGTPSTKKAEYWDDGDIIWVTPTDITRNPCLALLDSEKKITEVGLKGSSAKMLPPDTIMMTSRASVGFFALIDKPACTNQGFISVIPNEPLSRMYLLHNLMHRVEEIRSHAGGATYKEISKSKFKALPVVMPSLPLLRDFEEHATDILRHLRTLHTMNARLSQARDLLLPRLMSGEIAV